MAFLYPTPEEIAAAVEWAVNARRAKVRRTPAGLLLSDAALEERVSGYAVRPEPYGIGWWVVGVLVDVTDVEHNEYSIITVPGAAMLRTKPRYEVEPPEPTKQPRVYYSAATKRYEINPDVPES